MTFFEQYIRYVHRHWISVVISAVVSYLLILPTMAYTFIAADDWLFEFDPRGRLEWYYGIGRVGHDYVRAILAPLISPHYSIFLYVAGLIICGVTISYLFRLEKRFEIVAAVLVFVMYPMHIENMTYKDNHAPLFVAFTASAIYLVLLFGSRRISWWRLPALVVPLLVALLTHQSTALFMVTAAVATCLVDAVRNRADATREAEGRPAPPAVAAPLLLLSFAVAAPLYVGIVAYHRTLVEKWPIPSEYLLIESLNRHPAQFLSSARSFGSHVFQFVFRTQHLIPESVKLVFLAMAAVAIVNIVLVFRRRAVLPLLAFAAVVLAPWSLGLLRDTWTNYKYTAIGLPTSVVYPTVLTLFLIAVRNREAVRRAGLIASAAVVLIFFQQLSTVMFAAKTISDRDAAISNRLLSDIERQARERSISLDAPQAVVIDGAPMRSMYDQGPPFTGLITRGPMSTSTMLCGIYSCDVTKIPLSLRSLDIAYDGRRSYFFGAHSYLWQFRDHQPVADAEAILHDMPAWPREGSVRSVGQTVFVKIGDR